MVQVIIITFNDDSYATMDIHVKVSSSFENAEKFILDNLNQQFYLDCDSLPKVVRELDEEVTKCVWVEREKMFSWYNNGKGEAYFIANVYENNIGTQLIGTI